MGRTLRTSVALSAFALGLTLAGAAGQLPYALPAVLLLWLALSALWRRVRRPDIDAHAVKVAALTLSLWALILSLVVTLISEPYSDSFVYESPAAAPERAAPVTAAPPSVEWDAGLVCRLGVAGPVGEPANVIWGGVIDRKALSKPSPACPFVACRREVPSTVAVAVVVDGFGRVVVARPLSGPPHLRTSAALAACEARFSPLNTDGGAPPLVSGLLTYRFGD